MITSKHIGQTVEWFDGERRCLRSGELIGVTSNGREAFVRWLNVRGKPEVLRIGADQLKIKLDKV